MDLTSLRERVLVDLLRWAPKETFSRVVGACARQPLPRGLRATVYETFARRVGADLDEVEQALEEYPTLDAFFTRKLKAGARPIEAAPDTIVSPCDGTVSEFGLARGGTLIQAKGHDYRLESLLCDADAAARLEGGVYVTIYLAPRDYHRVHFASEGRVTGFQHIPGAVFPVNSLAVKHIPGLFAKNERLVTYQDGPAGEVATVMVAATGVGHITVTYDDVATHSAKLGRPGPRVNLSSPRPVARGDELGTFHLGSTVVLVFEPGRVELGDLTPGQRILLGQPLARRVKVNRGTGRRGDALS